MARASSEPIVLCDYERKTCSEPAKSTPHISPPDRLLLRTSSRSSNTRFAAGPSMRHDLSSLHTFSFRATGVTIFTTRMSSQSASQSEE